MRFFRRLVLAGLLCLAAAAVYIGIDLNTPYDGFGKQAFVDFPKGTSTKRMAEMLAAAGVIRHGWAFLAARAVRKNATLQAGQYRFATPASVLDVFDRIARGDIFYYELVVPEGKNIFDIGASVERLGVFPASQFLNAARDPALIRDLDPQAPSLEGYLFPNTYRISRHTTPEQLCRLMTGKFREVWRGLHTQAPIHRTVTMASLVEKEGKLAEERPVIAAVFLNRLEIGMKLDCDPTTIYASLLEGKSHRAILRSDLASGNAYNTYQHAGLPPGPIANPGIASIQAVLRPANADYLYFVLRPDASGGHQFSRNLADQQAAILRYRRSIAR